MGSIIGIIILVLDILAIVQCLKSNKSGGKKALWIAIIFFIPLIGLIAYYFIGRK